MPEIEIGTTSRTNAPKRVRPSTIAASSSSRGIDLKNPISNQVENGIVKLGYTNTSDQMVSCKPSNATTRDSGIKSKVGGTRYVRNIAMTIRSPHFPVSGASSETAGKESTSVIRTTSAQTSSVLPAQRKYIVSRKSTCRCNR